MPQPLVQPAGEGGGVSTLPPGPFKLALMDPPWAFRTFNGRNRTPTQKKFPCAQVAGSEAGRDGQRDSATKSFREAEDHYPTMSVAEMAALPVGEMMARDSAIAMWVVGSHCDAAIELAAAWGFSYTTDLLCWLKQKLIDAQQADLFTGDIPPPRMSMGYYTRKQKEDCWLFTRGRGLPVMAHDVRQVIVAPSAGHSRKPAEQYDRIERLFGGCELGADLPAEALPRIELFARNTRPGWACWGNEVGKFDAAQAEQVAA